MTASSSIVFDSPIGICGLAWSNRGVTHLQLPEVDLTATAARLEERSGVTPSARRPPGGIKQLIQRLNRHLRGRPDSLRDVKVDIQKASPFARKVYEFMRKIAPGEVLSYGELARRVGSPQAARAVGSAVGANPLPLLVPCHRVIGGNGKLGGFSSHDGLTLKAKLLFREGVVLDDTHAAGLAALRRADPVLRRIIQRVGPYLIAADRPADPYESLVSSILHQQISMKAASTICGRLRALGRGGSYPTAEHFARLSDAELRAVGVSAQKSSYLRDLSARVASGDLPLGRLSRLPDEQVIDALTQVRGIGRWSAQMYLMFNLNRLDVLPVDDLGFKAGVQVAYGLPAMPTAAQLGERGERWRPYRSMATWYLWQNLGLERQRQESFGG